MRRSDFGRIVKSLREDLRDPHTGKPWSQQHLADAIGKSRRIIGRIEKGEQIKLEDDLLALSDALNLHAFMRREFLAAAVDIDEEWCIDDCDQEAEQAFQHAWSILESVHLPAYLFDPVYDLIGINNTMMRFHGLTLEALDAMKQTKVGANVLALLYQRNSQLQYSMGKRWQDIARSNVQQFLFTSLPVCHTKRFQVLLPALKQLPDFPFDYWKQREAPEPFYSQLRPFEYHHALYGRVNYTVANTSTRTPYGYLILAIFVPLDAETSAIFSKIQEADARRVAPWFNSEFHL